MKASRAMPGTPLGLGRKLSDELGEELGIVLLGPLVGDDAIINATVRAKAMFQLDRDESRKCDVIPLEMKVDGSTMRAKFLERVEQKVAGVKLEDHSGNK